VNDGRLLDQWSRILFSGLLLLSCGCVHRIHVSPVAPTTAPATIAQSVQVLVPFLAMEGADHMPGITLLEWPADDLRNAMIDYIRSRQTFVSVTDNPADLILRVKAWLTMRSRGDYRYRLRLEAGLGPSEKAPIKSYVVERDAVGSSIRWSAASDQGPIAEAVQAALDDLLSQIETDYLLYRKGSR